MRFGEPFKNTPISLDFPNYVDLRGWILVPVEIFPPVPCPILVLGVPNSPQLWPPVDSNGSIHDLYQYSKTMTPEGPRISDLRSIDLTCQRGMRIVSRDWNQLNFFRRRNLKKLLNSSIRGIPTTKSPKSSDVHPLQFRRLRGWWRGEIGVDFWKFYHPWH